MSVDLRKIVRFGETFRIEAEIRNFPTFGETEGVLTDPSSHTIKLLKPDGTQQGDTMTTPSRADAGQFTQDMAIPSDGPAGEWRVQWTAPILTKAKPAEIRVKVAE